MNSRLYLFACLFTFSILASAQASGGQIRRGKPATQTNRHQNKKVSSQKNYNPVDMEPYTYYLCINETWVVRNGQDLCRKMESKGYNVELVKDPDPSFGYHVCVFKTKDKELAINFYNNFKDDRWGIAYPFYNREFLGSDFPNKIPEDIMTQGNNLNEGESEGEVIALIPITEAFFDGNNVSEWAKKNEITTILYKAGEELHMANVSLKEETESFGPLIIQDTQTEPETSTTYKTDKWVGEWKYENSYDNVKGTCKFCFTMVDKPTFVSCILQLITEKEEKWEYHGVIEK